MRISNVNNLPLLLQVWALYDDYDYNSDPYTISTTTLLKSVKQIILGTRVKDSDISVDVSDFIASRLGTAIHDSIEKSWKNRDKVIKKLNLNLDNVDIRVEERNERKLGKWTITGKFDGVVDGSVEDHKSTSVYAWIFNSNDQDYIRQLSINRWINQDLVTSEIGRINYIFTDWQKSKAKYDKNYPSSRIMSKLYNLMSFQETENFIRNKIDLLDKYWDSPEEDIPDCTDEELWRNAPVYKYYSDATKITGRSTKNFDNAAEAYAMQASKGKGTVIMVPGEPKRCLYCPAFPICQQRKRYYTDERELIE